jgi:N-acyl-D-amino-acid deacylase
VSAPVDLLIAGGSLVDGSGAPARRGAVAVSDGVLRLLAEGAELPPAGRRIDARGMVVCPGFVDLHSHGGLAVLADPRHEPKVSQGVTTEIVGVDGNGYAPFRRRADLLDFVDLNAGLDGRPEIAFDWDTFAAYLRRYDAGQAVNIGVMVGNSELRSAAVGWEDLPADERAVRDMRAMLREAMQDGAFGISSGLDYPPGAYASTDELASLANEAGQHGGFYHTHVRYPLGDRFLDPFREALEIGRRGEGAVHLTHFYHRQTYPGTPGQMLALVDDARADGADVTWDTYPYEWASTRLLIQLPLWIQSGGPGRLKERLADPTARDRLRAELLARGAAYASSAGWADLRLGAFTQPDNLRWESRTLAEVMDERGVDAVDAICDLLLTENLGVTQVTSGPWTDGLRRFLAHPGAMIGTDSTFFGAAPSPRTYGSYPRILGQFVRDEALMSLEEAVHRMTGALAARLGLRRRGVLRDGYAADVVVFDPLRVRAMATYEAPRQLPQGIRHVLVGGQAVIDEGRHTGALPGQALRHGTA